MPFNDLKKCSKCGEVKVLAEFSRNSAAPDGKRPDCKECNCIRQRAYYQANREAIRQRWHEIHWPKFREAIHRQARKHYADNAEYYKEKHRQYGKANRIKTREYCRRYDAKKWGSKVDKRVSYSKVIKRDNGYCYLCGWIVLDADLVLDHVVPISRGGTHSESNLAVTHRRCNNKKQSKLVSELVDVQF